MSSLKCNTMQKMHAKMGCGNSAQGSSINDVTVLKGGGQGFCDYNSKAFDKICDGGGRGGQKLSKIV